MCVHIREAVCESCSERVRAVSEVEGSRMRAWNVRRDFGWVNVVGDCGDAND